MNLRRFYLTAFLWSWGWWIAGILLLNGSGSANLVVSIGGIGPLVATALALFFRTGSSIRRGYARRLVRFRTGRPEAWAVAVFLPIAAYLVPALISGVRGIDRLLFPTEEFRCAGPVYFLFLLIFGPVPEEMAWRGIAMDGIVDRGYVRAQLIVAAFWMAWHIPLFFIKGSYQASLGLFTAEGGLFFANILFLSFIAGRIYLRSGGSIPVAITFHYMVNLLGEMYDLSRTGEVLQLTIFAVAGVAALFSGGGFDS